MRWITILSLLFTLACETEEAKELARQAAEVAQKAAEAAKKAAEQAQKGSDGEGSEEPNEEGRGAPNSGPKSLEDALSQMKDAFEKHGQTLEPIDFRELKGMLPKRLRDLEQTEVDGQKSGAFGLKIARADARYERGDARIDVKITDTAGARAFAGMAAAAWSVAEIDREWDEGYERTTMFRGHKAYEKFDKKDMRGEIQVIVEGRFVIEAKGRKVKMDAIKEAVSILPLETLAARHRADKAEGERKAEEK